MDELYGDLGDHPSGKTVSVLMSTALVILLKLYCTFFYVSSKYLLKMLFWCKIILW